MTSVGCQIRPALHVKGEVADHAAVRPFADDFTSHDSHHGSRRWASLAVVEAAGFAQRIVDLGTYHST